MRYVDARRRKKTPHFGGRGKCPRVGPRDLQLVSAGAPPFVFKGGFVGVLPQACCDYKPL